MADKGWRENLDNAIESLIPACQKVSTLELTFQRTMSYIQALYDADVISFTTMQMYVKKLADAYNERANSLYKS